MDTHTRGRPACIAHDLASRARKGSESWYSGQIKPAAAMQGGQGKQAGISTNKKKRKRTRTVFCWRTRCMIVVKSDYCGEVIDQHLATLAVHSRALRVFIGLPKNTGSVGVLIEVYWLLPSTELGSEWSEFSIE